MYSRRFSDSEPQEIVIPSSYAGTALHQEPVRPAESPPAGEEPTEEKAEKAGQEEQRAASDAGVAEPPERAGDDVFASLRKDLPEGVDEEALLLIGIAFLIRTAEPREEILPLALLCLLFL